MRLASLTEQGTDIEAAVAGGEDAVVLLVSIERMQSVVGSVWHDVAYLRQLPLDKLKIDRSFVSNIENDLGDATLVRSIVDLGHSLNLKVIAEGVESQWQLEFLKKIGCEEAQGYFYSRPVGADIFEQLLHEPVQNNQSIG